MKKNKNNRKIAAAVLSLSTAAVLLAGSTFAWFAISNTAEATISGTAAKVENMKVGVVSDVDLTTISTYGSEFENRDGAYFVKEYNEGSDAARTTVLQNALNAGIQAAVRNGTSGNLTNNLTPVTSGKNNGNEEINLKKAPTEAKPTYTESDEATVKDYIEYTLAFETTEGNTAIYLNRAGMNFAITKLVGGTATDQDPKLMQALRVGFTSNETTARSTIFAPISMNDNASAIDNADVTTEVGGKLDLNGDGVWDYKESRDSTVATSTIWYGEIDGDLTEDAVADGDTTAIPREKVNTDSFTAAYLEYRNEAYERTVTKAEGTAPTQTAFGMDTLTYVAGNDDNKPIAISDSDGKAQITVTIWLEGWDKSCTNDVMEVSASTTLAFVAPMPSTIA